MAVDLSRFVKPHLECVELVLNNGATAQILPAAFTNQGRRWLKRVILSAHDRADNIIANIPANNSAFLGRITGRWWLRMKEEASGNQIQLPMFDSQRWERCSSQVPGGGPMFWQLGWTFDAPFVVPDNDTMFVAWSNRGEVAGGAAVAAGQFHVAVYGYGVVSGKPRMLHTNVAWAGNPVGLTPTFGTAPTIQNAQNQFGEDIMATGMAITADGTDTNVADGRLFNHIVARVYFESKSSFSLCGRQPNEYVPLVAYGSHRNLDARVAIWEPQGDPMILENNDALGWEFVNGAGQVERIQVILVTLLEE